MQNLSLLQRLGFPVVIHSPELHSAEERSTFAGLGKRSATELDFPVDGIVFKVNDLGQQQASWDNSQITTLGDSL